MIRDWLRNWLGLETLDSSLGYLSRSNEARKDDIQSVRDQIDIIYKHDLLPQNLHTRIVATENSLRLIENRLKLIEGLEWADGTVGEHAARKAMREQEDKQLRLDQSAAKVRGMTLDEYRADVARRKAEKAEKSARETISEDIDHDRA